MSIDHESERRVMERTYEGISPFELKNQLISLAKAGEQKSIRAMLDAGRGNPNWIAPAPREAFFALGQFGIAESRRVWDEGDLAGKPNLKGIAQRFNQYVEDHHQVPGIKLLQEIVDFGVTKLGFEADPWVYELTDGIIGDNYPTPDRMLVHSERIVREFLRQELCPSNGDRLDLFAVEGATAAMCYIFDSLMENQLLSRGDTIAIMVPIFPPYVEIPQLDKYAFGVTEIRATSRNSDGEHTWQYPTSELDKLKDPSIRALFLVNPSNPPSIAIDPQSMQHLVHTVRQYNPNLIIISDEVYSTFVDNYRSILEDLPYHTIGVYSFSKYFGVTGWRLGVIALNHQNVCDTLLGQLNESQKEHLKRRYASLTLHPDELGFMDRMVADSRQVALNHTAGLSTPQQVQMTLLAGFALVDTENQYKQRTKDICHRRMKLLYDGLDLPCPNLPFDADYYTEFDLGDWAKARYGDAFLHFLTENYEPVDILFRVAESSSIVLLNGGGFHAPEWSIRVSLANLEDEAYSKIGRVLREVLSEYVTEWKRQPHG